MDEKEAQALYEKFISLQQEAEQLNNQFSGIQEQLATIEKTRKTIHELQEMKTASETWVPIAPGAYIKATTQPLGPILLNVGASVAVEKTPEDVLKTLDEHAGILNELSEAALSELKEYMEQIEAIRSKVEATQPPSANEAHSHNHDHTHHH